MIRSGESAKDLLGAAKGGTNVNKMRRRVSGAWMIAERFRALVEPVRRFFTPRALPLPGVARFRFGRAGEHLAERSLRRLGYRIVERNYRAAGAEIDLVAMDGETLVFVEVKRRGGTGAGAPEEAVNQAKQEKIRRAAEVFVARYHEARRDARFDVIAIVENEGRSTLRHFKDAF